MLKPLSPQKNKSLLVTQSIQSIIFLGISSVSVLQLVSFNCQVGFNSISFLVYKFSFIWKVASRKPCILVIRLLQLISSSLQNVKQLSHWLVSIHQKLFILYAASSHLHLPVISRPSPPFPMLDMLDCQIVFELISFSTHQLLISQVASSQQVFTTITNKPPGSTPVIFRPSPPFTMLDMLLVRQSNSFWTD